MRIDVYLSKKKILARDLMFCFYVYSIVGILNAQKVKKSK